MTEIKLDNKKQLSSFLEIILLKGLDSRGKDNPNFHGCVLFFKEGEQGHVNVESYGQNEGNSLFFNHQMSMESSSTITDFNLAVPDIKTWMKYINDLNGDSITISISDGMVYLEGDDGGYYEIPDTDTVSITPVSSLPNGPIISYSNSSEIDLFNLWESEELSSEEWSIFEFRPQDLMDATDSGKNVETLTTTITLTISGIDIEVGNLPAAGPGPKFVKEDVPNINCVNWTWDEGTEKQWVGVLGINPATRILDMLGTEKARFYYKNGEKNLIILSDESSSHGQKVVLLWMISPVSQHQGTFIDASQEDDE